MAAVQMRYRVRKISLGGVSRQKAAAVLEHTTRVFVWKMQTFRECWIQQRISRQVNKQFVEEIQSSVAGND